MILNFQNYIKESVDEHVIEIIPMDIRKKYDPEFKNGEYKGKNIDHYYDLKAGRNVEELIDLYKKDWKPEFKGGPTYSPSQYSIINIFTDRDKRYFFAPNDEYLDHMRSLLMGKRVGYFNWGDEVKPNYYYVIPVVRRVAFNTYGDLIVAGGGGFFGENLGIGAHFGGPIDERMPLKIISPKTIISKEDPYGEEDWNS